MRDKRRKTRKRRKLTGSDVLIIGFFILLVVGIAYVVSLPASSPGQSAATLARGKVGDVAQDFRLPTAAGGFVSLSTYKGSNVLLFFSEGVGCDPCWRQIVELQKSLQSSGMGVSLIAITVDPVDQLRPVIQKWGIEVPVASDTSRKIAAAYDALYVGSMHPGQKPGHTFILVGPDGIIKWRYDLPQDQANSGNMYVPTEEVIQAIRKALGSD